MTKTAWLPTVLCLAASLAVVGCGDDDADDHGDDDAAVTRDGGKDAGGGSAMCSPRRGTPAPTSCEPNDGDYSPCTDDGYAACVSDDGEYHRIQESISSIARVAAFEEIAELLFDPTSAASGDDFLDARMLYQEDEGLDSRVVRRYDPYAEAPDGTDCTADGVPAQYPDYCVGPAKLQPILLDAFAKGALGEAPQEQAARIEAALLYFLFISSNKEAHSCTTTIVDCDSAYVYYTGGEEARGGLGLARYVKRVDAYAHDRAWDGLLAVRCWRDLDDGAMAEDLALRDRARAQYFSALVDGVAAIVRDRLEQLADSTGDEQRNHFAFVTTLGPALLPEAMERSSSDASDLADELAKTDPAELDTDAAIAAIDALFECP